MEDKKSYTHEEMEEALFACRDYFIYKEVVNGKMLSLYKKDLDMKIPKSLVNKIQKFEVE